MPSLRVVYAPRIYPILQPGALLADGQRPDPYIVETITDRGAHCDGGEFLTVAAIDSMRLIENGPAPKRAA